MVDRKSHTLGRYTTFVDSFVRSLTDFVLPPRCPLCTRAIEPPDPHAFCSDCLSQVTFIGSPLCTRCGTPFASSGEEDHLCGRCLTEVVPYDTARAVYAFSGSIREAIHAFKYQNKTYLAKTLVRFMERSSLQFDFHHYDALVPVPLHRNRLIQRGYNQSLLLAREIGHRHRVPVDARMLIKVQDSIPQTELTGVRRKQNVRGVFALGGNPGGKTILLIDDVLTTGATVSECARVLRRGGARKTDILAMARAV